MQRTITISTIDELIDALGGPSKAAEVLGTSSQNVCNWSSRKEISPGWHLPIMIEARARGWRLSPKLFGMTIRQLTKLKKLESETPLEVFAVA